jgi:hypothetical protein
MRNASATKQPTPMSGERIEPQHAVLLVVEPAIDLQHIE